MFVPRKKPLGIPSYSLASLSSQEISLLSGALNSPPTIVSSVCYYPMMKSPKIDLEKENIKLLQVLWQRWLVINSASDLTAKPAQSDQGERDRTSQAWSASKARNDLIALKNGKTSAV